MHLFRSMSKPQVEIFKQLQYAGNWIGDLEKIIRLSSLPWSPFTMAWNLDSPALLDFKYIFRPRGYRKKANLAGLQEPYILPIPTNWYQFWENLSIGYFYHSIQKEIEHPDKICTIFLLKYIYRSTLLTSLIYLKPSSLLVNYTKFSEESNDQDYSLGWFDAFFMFHKKFTARVDITI